ncbi:Mur ligase family protein [Pontibacter sp. G13]|uniref:UDP-N-acetylmuramate--L-alanine ligase n=1 Tax=Pontibacter sp. G13 TaxID=3074898 RepID=UPI00288AB360|nr:Mur ligase family protein [Pontibacter sp. G13]WNJ18859.1 Mur ligase family protein [Pontibacter sp. G13]
MNIHFIAVGGSIMHSLAIALKQAGHNVTGSDDQIYDPAKSKLAQHGILPDREGWDPARITEDLDAVILGMHAFDDNPELAKARALGLDIYSFPAFMFEHARNKQRVVIAGSYGKTTITSMIMHVLQGLGLPFDYLVGAQVPGFQNAVRLSDDAPVLLLEGDEYLASKLDPRPKFLLYHPHITVISGISWDHINVFPTEEMYVEQFGLLLDSMDKAGSVIYHSEDKDLSKLVESRLDPDQHYIFPYKTPKYRVKDGKFAITLEGEERAMKVMGKHNMANIAAAWGVCSLMSVDVKDFLDQMATFEGAKLRLEYLEETDHKVVIRDYAHAPAKVQATVEAVRERYKQENLIACLELHSFSSLNKDYLPYYKDTMKGADQRIVYVNPHAWEKRRMPALNQADITQAFGDEGLTFVTDAGQLNGILQGAKNGNDVVLMMSSGNFGGIDLDSL